MALADEIQIDFLILGDYAEVLGGKLYLMGGAWDRIAIRDPAQPLRFSVALAILVPWVATNQTHTLRVTLEDADGVEQGMFIESTFVTGRPPELRPGTTQRVLLAVNSLGAAPPAGDYALVASVDGDERRRVGFVVVQS
ncbi:MAG: hypothetical protein QOF51_3308 [Chloroflexota bacterium]|jgi:hypothetical protein|nr:hypothetical protein [Chloroflexota bacterium]